MACIEMLSSLHSRLGLEHMGRMMGVCVCVDGGEEEAGGWRQARGG